MLNIFQYFRSAVKFTIFSYPYFAVVTMWFFYIFWNALVIVSPFWCFNGITHAYLLCTSIAHNKKRILLLCLLINCISAKSALKMLSIKDKHTLRCWNFLVITLCSSEAYFWFNVYLLFNPFPLDFIIRKFINHWRKSSLISIIFSNTSNFKYFITLYFFWSCSSC